MKPPRSADQEQPAHPLAADELFTRVEDAEGVVRGVDDGLRIAQLEGFRARRERGIGLVEVEVADAHAVERPRRERGLSRLEQALLQLRSGELDEFAPLARTAFCEVRAQCKELGGRLVGRVVG